MKIFLTILCFGFLLHSTSSYELVHDNHTSPDEGSEDEWSDDEWSEDGWSEEGDWSDDDSIETIDGFEELGGLSLLEFLCSKFNVSASECTCENFQHVCTTETEHKEWVNTSAIGIFERLNTTTIVYASVAMASSAFGLIGNAMVLFVAYNHRRRIGSGKLHIAQLALVNLMCSAIQFISNVHLFWTNVWLYGFFMCKFLRSVYELCNFLTIGFVLVIAIER